MYEAGFTFKEAMYTFTQLFPDAGVQYDLSDQNGTRTYSKVSDNEASGTLYKTIGEQILNYWNVGGSAATEGDDSTSGEVDRFDPMTFQDGNTTYTFLNAEKWKTAHLITQTANKMTYWVQKEALKNFLHTTTTAMV